MVHPSPSAAPAKCAPAIRPSVHLSACPPVRLSARPGNLPRPGPVKPSDHPPASPPLAEILVPRASTCARLSAAAMLLPVLGCSHSASAPGTAAPAATTAAITPADLRQRLSIFADDSMEGRKAGTRGNVKGTDYIAAEARRIGLQPAGDDGG